MPLDIFRKMIEVVFKDSEAEIGIYTPRQAPEYVKGDKGIDKGRKTYALVVKEEGGTYRDILSKVRPVLANNGGREAIKEVKSTKEGSLLITMDRDEEAFEKIKASIDSLQNSLKILGAWREGKKLPSSI